MNHVIPLNTDQRNMVENNLQLVKRTIYKYITVNDTILGLDLMIFFKRDAFGFAKPPQLFGKTRA